MDTNIDFKALWARAAESQMPDSREIIDAAIRLNKKMRNKMLMANLCLVASAIFIIFVVFHYHPAMWTTWLGTALIIVAILFNLAASGNVIRLLFKSNLEVDTTAYLQHLLHIRQKQEYLQTTMLSLYYILLSAGLALYMIEYALMMQTTGRVLTYGITAIWIGFNWFYIRPKTVKKQRAKMDAMISKIGALNMQLLD